MKKIPLNFLIYLLLFSSSTFINAQNIKDDVVEYRYVKLPLNPLPSIITNYQSTIFAPYEEENKKKKEKYEAEKKLAEEDFQKEKEQYPAKVKAAEDKYNAEMEVWKKKSLTEKVVEKQVLGENNKPVKHIPSAPYLRYVQAPDLRTSYDYPVVANTYLALDGFINKADNAIKYEVTLYGFDYTEPRQLSEQKSVTNFSNGQSQTSNVTYYHNEFSYRHTMSVKVTSPDGKEILNVTPQELNNYKIYKSPESTTPTAINNQLLIKSVEEKILQDNLKLINDLVNDKIGFQRVTRKPKLFYVKSKDETYQDLLIAYNDAVSGLKTLVDNPDLSKQKLQTAIQTWNKALLESDVKNKKARIDKDVTIAIGLNLLECYFASNDFAGTEKTLSVLNTIDLSSSERKLKSEYENLLIDAKKRFQNKNN